MLFCISKEHVLVGRIILFEFYFLHLLLISFYCLLQFHFAPTAQYIEQERFKANMGQASSTVSIELDMLRVKVSNLEKTINDMAFTRNLAEASHEREIGTLQERINGGHIDVRFVQYIHFY